MLDPAEASRGLVEALQAFASATATAGEPATVRIAVGPIDGQPRYIDLGATAAVWLDDAVRNEATSARRGGPDPNDDRY